MDKADLALFVACASALFTGWQSYSGFISMRLAKNAAKRKEPAFEISNSASKQFAEWHQVSIVARNFEPVSVRVTGFKYRGRNVSLLNSQEQWREGERRWDTPQHVDELPKDKASRHISYKHTLGAAGSQETRSSAPHTPRPTEYFGLLAHGSFSADRLEVVWEWADGQKR